MRDCPSRALMSCGRSECVVECVLQKPTITWPMSWPMFQYPVGCICPPASEQTCQNPQCGRKAPQPLIATCSTGGEQ